jgi:subtilisin family serine protease
MERRVSEKDPPFLNWQTLDIFGILNISMEEQPGKKKRLLLWGMIGGGGVILLLLIFFVFSFVKRAQESNTDTVSVPEPSLPRLDPKTEVVANADGISIAKNIIEIIWKPEATASEKQTAVASVTGATVRGEVAALGFTEISVPDGSFTGALLTLPEQPGVAAATEAYVAQLNYAPLDPDYKDFTKMWWLERVEAEPAWEMSQGNPNMLVAVIDGGFLTDHQDLEGVFDETKGFNYSLADMEDDAEHGTHVSGIIGMQPNDIGMAGIAPNVKIVPYKVVTFAQMADSFRMAADTTGVSVISISQGYNWWSQNQARAAAGQPAFTPAQMQAASQATDLIMNPAAAYAKQKGVVIVHSAGNDSQTAAYNTLNTTDVVTVANTDQYDGLSTTSNFGPPVTIGAPGSSIWSTVDLYEWDYLSGTSMATPLVSGIVALMRSANPDLTFDDIVSTLQKTGEPSISAGLESRVNAWQALLAVTDRYGVKGMVVDKNDAPVKGATVQPKGMPEWAITTNEFGKFTLAAIPRNGPWEITAQYGEEQGTLPITPLPADQWVVRDVTLSLANPNQPQLDTVSLKFHGEAEGQCRYQDAGFQPGDSFFALGCDEKGACANPTSLDIRFDGPIRFSDGGQTSGAFTGQLSEYWSQNYREGELDAIMFSGSIANLADQSQVTLDIRGTQHTTTGDLPIHALVTGTIVKVDNQNDLHYGYSIRVDDYAIDPYQIDVQNPHYQTQQAICTFDYDPITDPLATNPEYGYFTIDADYKLQPTSGAQNSSSMDELYLGN